MAGGMAAGTVAAVSGSALAGTGQRTAAQTTSVTAALGTSRALPPKFFGVNFDYMGARDYQSDPNFDTQLAALEPGTLRFPGGTGANFFQWKIGQPVDPPGKPCMSSTTSTQFKFTLKDLKQAHLAAGAAPIFDLNVMTSGMQCQLAMLSKAKQIGFKIQHVELGNEFYLGIKNYPKFFPTATGYGELVAKYVHALHSQFPGVRVAAVGSLPAGNSREKGWNAGMLKGAESVPDGTVPDAITMHVYPQFNVALTTSNLKTLFAEAYAKKAEVNQRVSQLPSPLPVWLTEYNLQPMHTANSNPPQSTFAQALFTTEMDLLLARVPSARLIDYWTAFGKSASSAYKGSASGPALTPGGLALQLVDKAAHNATHTTPIIFKGQPFLQKGDSALIGQVFTTGTTRREVLLNLSGQSLTIPTGTAIPAGQTFEKVSFSGGAVGKVGQASQLTVRHGTTGASLTLPAHSFAVVNP